jgi:proline-specific peptidase
MTAEREGWVEWRGHRTWYRVVGDLGAPRPPLVCLHGGPGSTHHYFAPLERLAADGRALVLYDQFGCGRSDRPAEVTWGVGLFLEELDAVRDQLELERVHLLGTSWGGMLALEHALARPGSLASLVLSSTLASAEEWQAEARRLRDELPLDALAALERLELAGTVDGPEYERALEPFDDRHFYRGAVTPPELERMQEERGREAYRAMWGPNEWTLTGALQGWDVRSRLAEIDVPTLVLRGRYDLSTPAIAATLVGGIRGSREVVFEESSHTPVLEETDRYLEVVGDFLREVELRP